MPISRGNGEEERLDAPPVPRVVRVETVELPSGSPVTFTSTFNSEEYERSFLDWLRSFVK